VIHLNTALHRIQARSQVLKFGRAKYILGGTIFVFIIFLKQIFWEENLGGTAPECPPRNYGPDRI